MEKNQLIKVRGARENNLKNINIDLPKDKLIVMTGLSGSGKSSLAFDTIYAEGQRRYLESLSSYARQFLGGNEKPDVDSIEGLSPTISIDQKSVNHNPRSTVGTATEIYDYLRVFFARVGTPLCPKGHGPILTQTVKQIVDSVMQYEQKSKLLILSPIAKSQKGSFVNEINNIKRDGYLRVRIDGQIYDLDEEININKNEKHNIEIVIDRIVLNHDSQTRSRIVSAVEIATKNSNGVVICNINDNDILYNENYTCNICNFSIPELEPRLFSFNSPIGACEYCKGLGYTFEPSIKRILPDENLTIDNGGVDYFKNLVDTTNLEWQRFKILLKHYNIPTNVKIKDLSEEDIRHILYGSDEAIQFSLSSTANTYVKNEYIEGIASLIKRRHYETTSEFAREYYSKYMAETPCKTCSGKKLNDAALCVKVAGKDIIDCTNMSIMDLIDYFLGLELTPEQSMISNLLLKEIINRLSFLKNVGLDYLTLSRRALTLSGGESQRIRLANQIGSHLTGILYVLDEPSIGLHQKDNEKLIDALKSIRDLGNTVLVIEHDEDTMLASDYLVDIGPGAGAFGGEVVACGTPQEVLANENSITGQYLSGKLKIDVPKTRRGGNGQKIILKGCKGNNLKNIDVTFPLNKFIAVTGVSGSGKSTLVLETFVKAIQKNNFDPFVEPLPYRDIIGCNHVDKLVIVNQEPIGRTPRSNPATYVGVFDDIRDIFAMVPLSKERGYLKGRFSFNVKGGRCEHCQGDGSIKIEMHFLPDVYIQCPECLGHKYNDETLQVKFRSKSIYDILEMSISEAKEFFINNHNIHHKLKLLDDVGLGYLKLGTSGVALSGGEAQRVKLAKFLQRKPTGKTIYVLDEPTTGLHTHDISHLIKILNKIVDNGDTVITIEHNLDLIKVADHIIDIGPDGGNNGGIVVATGTPEQIVNKDASHTATYLKKYLNQ
ncbi:MAG: excinuclease ABC subunit UvrA [Mycoplasma sp.]